MKKNSALLAGLMAAAIALPMVGTGAVSNAVTAARVETVRTPVTDTPTATDTPALTDKPAKQSGRSGARARAHDWFGPKPGTQPNPKVPEQCGTKITLVLDASGSIKDSGAQDKVREAARSFLVALENTGSQARVVDFASASRESAAMSLITTGSLSPGGIFDHALHLYYENGNKGVPAHQSAYKYKDYRYRDNPARESSYFRASGSPNLEENRYWTNWQEALERSAGSGTELIVFVTDGDPTAATSNGKSNHGLSREPHPGSRLINLYHGKPSEYALYKGINAANNAKNSGSHPRILAVGVGASLDNTASRQRLEDISGPNVFTGRGHFDINRYDVALVRRFDELGEALRRIAIDLCSPSLTITKLAQTADSTAYERAQGWNIGVEPTVASGSYEWVQPGKGDPPGLKRIATDSRGLAQFQWEPDRKVDSLAAVTETMKNGWAFDSVDCLRLDDGRPYTRSPFDSNGEVTYSSPGFHLPLGHDSIATCEYRNKFLYRPGIDIKKTAKDDPVRANADGWNEKYTFEVTNTGNTPLAAVNPIDSQCTNIQGPQGDANQDGKLDATETWTYTCDRLIQRATTNQDISSTNTVEVTGVPPTGPPVEARATKTVDVKTPAVSVAKSARLPDGTVIQPGDKVPAGKTVIYEYTVTNPGNDVVHDVQVSDDKCSPLRRVTGSGSTLAPADTWVYECSQTLQPSSIDSTVTNVATVSALWSNPHNKTQNNGRVTNKATKTIGVDKSATINIVKAIPSGNGNQAFPFTASGPGVANADQSFNLNPGGSPAKPSRSIVVVPAAGGSDYTIVETPSGPGHPGPDGWDLTDLTCDKQGSTINLATGTATVNLSQGETATCVYIDKRLPSLTISKHTSPIGVTKKFGFTTSRPAPFAPLSPATFELADGDTQRYTDVPVGEVAITESSLPAGWRLDQLDCGVHAGTVTGAEIRLTLDYDEDVVCHYSNAKLAPAAITITKSGTAQQPAPDFGFTAAGEGLNQPGQPGQQTFKIPLLGSKSLTVHPSGTGDDYTITENVLPTPGAGQSPWVRTSIECVLDSDPSNRITGNLTSGAVVVPLEPGQHAACSYVNELKPRLTIIKHVVVGVGQSGADKEFNFVGSGDNMSNATLGDSDTKVYPNLTAGGQISVVEQAETGWIVSGLQCAGVGAGRLTATTSTGTVAGALMHGDDVTCQYVNTKNPSRPATLTVSKSVVPAETAPGFDFTLSGTRVPDGDKSFNLTPDASGAASRTITMVPDDAGSDYTLTESALPDGWELTRMKCAVNNAPAGIYTEPSVRLSLQPGDLATCNYINKPKAKLTILKRVSVAAGQSGANTEFDFTTTGLGGATPKLGDADTRVFSRLDAGSPISVTETSKPGWSTTVDCVGTGSSHYQVSGAKVTGTGVSGDDVTCSYVNTKHRDNGATLTVIKHTNPAKAGPNFDFDLTANHPDPATDPFKLQPDTTGAATKVFSLVPFDQGQGGTTYDISETVPADWDLTDLACLVNGSPAGTDSGSTLSLNLVPDDVAVCTFTNEPKANLTILKQVSVATGQTGANTKFRFEVADPTPQAVELGNQDTHVFSSVSTGTRLAAEEAPKAGWTTTVKCVGSGSAHYQVSGLRVGGTAQPGDDVTCTYVNTKDPSHGATLTVVKHVEPVGAGPNFDFNLGANHTDSATGPFALQPDATGTATKVFTLVPFDSAQGGTTYKVSESVPTAWDLTDIECTINGSSGGTIGTENISVTLVPDDAAVCTFTNKPKASLTILKQVSVGTGQSGADTKFDFTTSGLGGATPNLGDGDTEVFGTLASGTATSVEEPAVSGWSTTVKCVGAGSGHYTIVGGKVSGTTQSGDKVTCTYVNTKDRSPGATLTVVKQVEPAEAGPDFNFDLTADHPDPATDPFKLQPDATGTATKVFSLVPFDAGTTYAIGESVPGDWDLTSLDCTINGSPGGSSGAHSAELRLVPNDLAVCTFTNKPKASLTILKHVSVGTGQSGADRKFGFTSNLPTAIPPLGHDEFSAHAGLTAGQDINVAESPVTGWSTTVTCTGTGAGRYTISGQAVSGTPTSGDDVTCMYVNVKDPLAPAILTVAKLADPDSTTTRFNFDAEGIGLNQVGVPGSVSFDLGDSELKSTYVHPVEKGNDYSATELATPGWDIIYIGCVKSSDPDNVIQGNLADGKVTIPGLLPGEVGVCLYGNQKPGSLRLQKVTDVPTTRVFDFSATNLMPSSVGVKSGDSALWRQIQAGAVVGVTERVPDTAADVPDRWALSDIACVGSADPATVDLPKANVSIKVGAGENVSCTYVNNKIKPATITVVKTASPADGTPFAFTSTGSDGGVLPKDQSFSLASNGAAASQTFDVYPPLGGETYTLTEQLTSMQAQDWRLTDIECASGGTPVGAVTKPAVAVDLRPGDSTTCTFTNHMNASLTVLKYADGDASNEFPFSWSIDQVPFLMADSDIKSVFPLAAGNYWTQENLNDPSFPTDWYLAGGNPVCTGTAIAPDYTRSGGANLAIGDGEQAWCLFTNHYDYRPEIQLVKNVDRTEVISGGTVRYSYDLTNVGNEDLQPAGAIADIVVDDKCAPVIPVGSPSAPLSPGDTWKFTCTSKNVTADVLNTAVATMPNPQKPNTPLKSRDTKSVTVLHPRLEIRKVAERDTVYPGTDVRFDYFVSNTGETPFRNPGLSKDEWVKDDKCSSVKYLHGDTNKDDILDPGELWVYECTSKVSVDTTNVATTTATPFVPPSTTTGPPQVGPPVTVTDTRTVEVIQKGITIDKVATGKGAVVHPDSVVVPNGTLVTYTYDVTSGVATTPMGHVTVVDDKCSSVKYQSGDNNGDNLLQPGETWTYTCEQLFLGTRTVVNTATVTAVEPKAGGTSTAKSKAKVVSHVSKIFVEKRPDRATIAEGDPVTYRYRVINPGPTVLDNIVVTDDKCSPVEYQSGDVDGNRILPPSETWIYTCTTTLSTSTTNVVVVTGTNPGGIKVTSTTSAVVQTIHPNETGIKVVKTASDSEVERGDKVKYTYTVTNPGFVPLGEVKKSVVDDKCADVKYVSGDIDNDGLLTSTRTGEFSDEIWVFECTMKLDQTTTNVVTVTGQPTIDRKPIGNKVTGTDKLTVKVPGGIVDPDKDKTPVGTPGGGGGSTPATTGARIGLLLLVAMSVLGLGSALVVASRRREE